MLFCRRFEAWKAHTRRTFQIQPGRVSKLRAGRQRNRKWGHQPGPKGRALVLRGHPVGLVELNSCKSNGFGSAQFSEQMKPRNQSCGRDWDRSGWFQWVCYLAQEMVLFCEFGRCSPKQDGLFVYSYIGASRHTRNYTRTSSHPGRSNSFPDLRQHPNS